MVLYHKSQYESEFTDMKAKYISTQSGKLLAFLNEFDRNCFGYNEAFQALPDSKEGTIRELLSDMVRRGLILRLKDGLFYVIPYEQDSESFMPDWHLLAQYLVSDAKHYIGYYSALQIHGLITQPSLREQIVVSKQIRPTVLKIKNIEFQFIYHNEKHFFGEKKIWVDNFNQVFCADLEKTLIDCLFKPDYAGGIVEIAKAIYAAKDKIKWEKLFDYVINFDSQAVIKRLGFLLETLGIGNQYVEKLQKMKTASYIILDTELPQIGKRLSRWSIQQNLDTETIKSAIYT